MDQPWAAYAAQAVVGAGPYEGTGGWCKRAPYSGGDAKGGCAADDPFILHSPFPVLHLKKLPPEREFF